MKKMVLIVPLAALMLAADAPEMVKAGMWVETISLESVSGDLMSKVELDQAKSRDEITRRCIKAGTSVHDRYAQILPISKDCNTARPPQVDTVAKTFSAEMQCGDKFATGSIRYSGRWAADEFSGRLQANVKKSDGKSGTINALITGKYSGEACQAGEATALAEEVEERHDPAVAAEVDAIFNAPAKAVGPMAAKAKPKPKRKATPVRKKRR